MPEAPLPGANGDGRNWYEALLESRSFFVDEARPYGDWGHPESQIVARAAVLVERFVDVDDEL